MPKPAGDEVSEAERANVSEAVQVLKETVLPKFTESIKDYHLATSPYEFDSKHIESWGLREEFTKFYEEEIEPYFADLTAAVNALPLVEKTRYLEEFSQSISEIGAAEFDRLPIVARACQFVIEAGDVNSLGYAKYIHDEFRLAHGKAFYEEWEDSNRTVYGDCTENKYADLQKFIISSVVNKHAGADTASEASEFLVSLIPAAGGMGDSFREAFEKLGTNNSHRVLLEALKNENELSRKMSAEILFRLEVGKIGITDREGVKYFDKVYQLATANDPEFFVRLYRQGNAYVRRLDTQGSIGVFNGTDDRLLGRFQLQLESPETLVKAPVSEITSRDVFLPKADETVEERRIRESMLQLYLAGYGKIFDQVDRQTGIKLSSLDLHEQGWFISYYSTATPEQHQVLTTFIKRYGELGLKAFLALDYGESGDSILNYINESAGNESQQLTLFSQFHKISVRAMEWRRVFEQAELGSALKFSAEIHEALLRKSSEYFRAALMIERGEGGTVTWEELLQSMQQISFALDALRGLYDKGSSLVLEKPKGEKGTNPQVLAEAIDKKSKVVAEGALTTWTLVDTKSGTRVVVSVRPQATIKGEARMNFRVVNEGKGVMARIGVDLSNHGGSEDGKEGVPAVSLDLGTGSVDKANRVFPSQQVGNILEMVEGSEGGHNEGSFSSNVAEHFEDIAHAFVNYMEQRTNRESLLGV